MDWMNWQAYEGTGPKLEDITNARNIFKLSETDVVHNLKTINPFFSAVTTCEKSFELREMDRDFKVGDILHLMHYNPGTGPFRKDDEYSGLFAHARITYILRHQDCTFGGLLPGWGILSTRLVRIGRIMSASFIESNKLKTVEIKP